jgi:catechol 2,3-dioxygenase-like lactoylglutathione lyase family enzyme
MKRMHVHVSVDNLAASIDFYSSLFGAGPSVHKTDYAKWMLDDPRVNFAISQRGERTGLNHLGIQVESGEELGQMQARLQGLQPDLEKEEAVPCCYAKSDKYWVTDPQGIAWETFHTLDAIPVFGERAPDRASAASCCIPLAKTEQQAPCCVPAGATAQDAPCC